MKILNTSGGKVSSWKKSFGQHVTYSAYFSVVLFAAVSIAQVAYTETPPLPDFKCQQEIAPNVQSNLVEKIDSRYQTVENLHANFEQKSYFAGLDTEKVTKGHVYFMKPGKMDWEYNLPESQRFVSDGQTFWYYQSDLKQVTVTNFDQSFQSALPISFLLGVGQLNRDFKLNTACYTAHHFAADLAPSNQDATLSRLVLLVTRESYDLIGAKVIDIGGNETTIVFTEIFFNQKIDASRFNFVIPQGVDIIDQRIAEPQGLPSPVVESDESPKAARPAVAAGDGK